MKQGNVHVNKKRSFFYIQKTKTKNNYKELNVLMYFLKTYLFKNNE